LSPVAVVLIWLGEGRTLSLGSVKLDTTASSEANSSVQPTNVVPGSPSRRQRPVIGGPVASISISTRNGSLNDMIETIVCRPELRIVDYPPVFDRERPHGSTLSGL